MDMDRLSMRRRGALMAIPFIITLLAMVSLAKTAHSQDESITVTCYKGNLEEGNQVGNLTVTNPSLAGQLCNSTYYDCQGECVGCFPDSDLGGEICYDNTGRKFLK